MFNIFYKTGIKILFFEVAKNGLKYNFRYKTWSIAERRRGHATISSLWQKGVIGPTSLSRLPVGLRYYYPVGSSFFPIELLALGSRFLLPYCRLYLAWKCVSESDTSSFPKGVAFRGGDIIVVRQYCETVKIALENPSA